HLRYAGQLRVTHKQASLEELGQLADPPMTKDAVAGRIRRLLSTADKHAEELGIPGTEASLTPEMLEDRSDRGMRRIAINGFGRIGRARVRLALGPGSDCDVVAINDLTDTATLAHLLTHDSVWPRFDHTVEAAEDSLSVDGRTVTVFSQADPGSIDWSAHGVELVVESTGRFTRRDQAEAHLGGSVGTVVLSAPGKDVDATFVMGVN